MKSLVSRWLLVLIFVLFLAVVLVLPVSARGLAQATDTPAPTFTPTPYVSAGDMVGYTYDVAQNAVPFLSVVVALGIFVGLVLLAKGLMR